MENQIYAYLRTHALGRDLAVKFDVIAQEFGITWREVAHAVEDLRLEGKVISTSRREPYGAYIPSSIDEARDSLRAGYAALWSAKKALDCLSASIEAQFGEDIVKSVQEEFTFKEDKCGSI